MALRGCRALGYEHSRLGEDGYGTGGQRKGAYASSNGITLRGRGVFHQRDISYAERRESADRKSVV